MATCGRPIDQATRQRIERLSREGRTTADIARQAHVDRKTVRRVSESQNQDQRRAR